MDESFEEFKTKVRIQIIWIIMILVCAITPAFVWPTISYWNTYEIVGYNAFAMLWQVIATGDGNVIVKLLDLQWLLISAPFTFPLFLFAVGVVRYCKSRISLFGLVGVGILSIILPLLALFGAFFMSITTGVFAYMGPVPIHIVVGIVVIKYVRIVPVSPWGDDQTPWWEEDIQVTA